MGLFVRRPLALASLVLAVGVVLGFLTEAPVAICIAVALVLLLAVLILLRIRRGANEKRFLLFLLTLFLLLGAVRGFWAEEQTRRFMGDHIGTEVETELSVLEVKHASAYASSFYVRVHTLNGERKNAKALLICHNALPLYAGDRVRATVRMEPYEYGDELGQNRGNGVQAVLVSESTESFVYLSHTEHPLAFFRNLQSRLSYLVRRAVGEEEGNLVAAILLGDDTHLSESTVRDFRRTGISHLLALSGLHVSILVGFVDTVLRLCRVGKRSRLLAALGFAFFYFFLTGCSYSVLRTLIMLGFVTLSFFLAAENDGVTALLFGAAVILLFAPHAVFDLSLQMTVLATLGILIFAPVAKSVKRRFSCKKGAKRAMHFLLRWVLTSLLLTYAASVALLLIQWLVFGQLALLTPLANLVIVPIATPLLILGFLCLPFFFLPGVSAAVGFLPSIFAKAILYGASALSQQRGMLSLRHSFAPWILIIFLAVTAVLVCVQLPRHRWLALTPMIPTILSFILAFGIAQNAAAGTVQVHYSAVNGRDGLALSQLQHGVILDVSGSDVSGLMQDWYTLQEQGVTELDALVLTGYAVGTQSTLHEFSKRVIVRALLLPEAQSEAERAHCTQLLAWCSDARIPVTVYSFDCALTLFEAGSLTVHTPLYEERSSSPALRIFIRMGNNTLAYESGVYQEYARHRGLEGAPPATHLILGGTGPTPREAVRTTGAYEGGWVVVGGESVFPQLDVRERRRYAFLPLYWGTCLS